VLGSGLGGQLAGLLTIRGLFAVSACTGIAAVVLIALAVLPVAGGGTEPASPVDPPNVTANAGASSPQA